MTIRGILIILILFCLFAYIGTQTLGRSIFFLGFFRVSFIPTMTSLKGQVKHLCATGRFEKFVKAESALLITHCSYQN